MRKKFMLSACFVVLLGVVGIASSAVEIKVDFGGSGVLDDSWTEWNAVAGNLTVDTVQFTLANSNQANGPKLRIGIGDALTKESLGSDDPAVGGVYTLTITNLPAGSYDLHTYFNNPTSYGYPWPGGGGQEVWVNGTRMAGPSPASYNETSANALVLSVSFTSSGTSDVITIDWKNSALPSNWINGFELISQGAMLQFAVTDSGDFEAVSPAQLEVMLTNADEGQSYAVDYNVVGGTATGGGVDYTLEAGTLTFNPGDTSEPISIDIIDDGVDEADETIIVELSNPAGPEAILGPRTQHTYTIRDPRPQVGFETEASRNREDAGLVGIPVVLSFAAMHTVSVEYAVIGGTATGGGVDYTSGPIGILTFNPGQTSKEVGIALVDDGVVEDPETIVIILSGITGGRPGIIQHTFTIVDPSFLELKVDLALPKWESAGIWTETAKEGWTIWAAEGWGDMYMHDWRGVRDLDGTGVDASITTVAEGRGGLKVKGMCMCDLNGGCAPNGSPQGEPIANSWYNSVDRVSNPIASVLLALYNLPVGEYELTSYHNFWQPCSSGSRDCTECEPTNIPPMPQIHVWSFADADDYKAWLDIHSPDNAGRYNDALNKIKGFAGPGPYATNVVTVQEAFNVAPSYTTYDDQVTTSVVKFWTDGSPVMIMYEAADFETGSQYIGGRGILNAFEVNAVGGGGCACLGDIADTAGFGPPDGKVDTGDMAKLLSELITGGGDAGNNYKVQNPSAELLSCGDLAGTDGFSAPDAQIDTGDMAKLLSHLIVNGDPDKNYEAGCVELP